MSAERDALDHFGRFIAENLRDPGIEHFDLLVRSHWKAPGLQSLQAALATLTPDQIAIARRAFVSSLDFAIHDCLFKLQEQAEFEARIAVSVDGVDVVAASDGIHAEAYGEGGWYRRFSKYGEPPDNE